MLNPRSLGVLGIVGFVACASPPASVAQTTPRPSVIAGTTTAAIADVAGTYEFGRANGGGVTSTGPLCRFTLTTVLTRDGFLIEQSCDGNESLWTLDGDRLLLLNGSGQVTTVLFQVAPGFWRGSYQPMPRIIHYLRRLG